MTFDNIAQAHVSSSATLLRYTNIATGIQKSIVLIAPSSSHACFGRRRCLAIARLSLFLFAEFDGNRCTQVLCRKIAGQRVYARHVMGVGMLIWPFSIGNAPIIIRPPVTFGSAVCPEFFLGAGASCHRVHGCPLLQMGACNRARSLDSSVREQRLGSLAWGIAQLVALPRCPRVAGLRRRASIDFRQTSTRAGRFRHGPSSIVASSAR